MCSISCLQSETKEIRKRIQSELAKGCVQIRSPSSSVITVESQQNSTRVSHTCDSDSDFEDQPKMVGKRKRLPFRNACSHDEQGEDSKSTVSPVHWEQLSADIQSVLPSDEQYT